MYFPNSNSDLTILFLVDLRKLVIISATFSDNLVTWVLARALSKELR